MSRFFGATLLGCALLVPAAMQAQDHKDSQNKRVYDSSHKDYHQWNDNENQAYHGWLKDNHKSEHDYSKASKKEQSAYWNWRHEHPDGH